MKAAETASTLAGVSGKTGASAPNHCPWNAHQVDQSVLAPDLALAADMSLSSSPRAASLLSGVAAACNAAGLDVPSVVGTAGKSVRDFFAGLPLGVPGAGPDEESTATALVSKLGFD